MDSQQLIQYGVGAQKNISGFSDHILSQIRSKDSGYVGELMTDLVVKVKEAEVDSGTRGSLISSPFLRMLPGNIKSCSSGMRSWRFRSIRSSSSWIRPEWRCLRISPCSDSLYEKNLEYFQELQIYIAAGEEKIKEIQMETLPKLREEAKAKGDPMSAQLVRDFEDTVSRFEKKIHDLKLSKTIAIQTAPQIRLIQNNDKALVEKIQTAVLNTIPLWKSQIVIALGLHRQESVLKLQKSVTDATNELLTKNAELLKQSSVGVAKEAERGNRRSGDIKEGERGSDFDHRGNYQDSERRPGSQTERGGRAGRNRREVKADASRRGRGKGERGPVQRLRPYDEVRLYSPQETGYVFCGDLFLQLDFASVDEYVAYLAFLR